MMVEVPPTPEEHLRRALLDLQQAHRLFVAAYGRPNEAEEAAHRADEARSQAAHWAALARAAAALGGEDADVSGTR